MDNIIYINVQQQKTTNGFAYDQHQPLLNENIYFHDSDYLICRYVLDINRGTGL